MFWILLKKQLLEINWTLFIDRKTGMAKSKAKVISSIVLFVVLMLVVAASFSSFTYAFISVSAAIGADWFGFTMSAILGAIFGVFGSVFNTYGMLYKSKDNELLVSMPIKAEDILLSRISGAFVMALLYTSLMVLPAIIIYQIIGGFNLGVLLASLFMLIVEAVFVTVLTCALGYVVAIISSKIKNKSVVTILSTLLFLGIYYAFCFRLGDYIQELVDNINSVTASFSRMFALYSVGRAYTGHIPSMLITTLATIALAALAIYIMSKNFFKIVNIKDVKTNRKFKAEQIRSSSIPSTLVKKELTRIVNTPIYLLNCGLGIVLMLVAACALFVKMNDINSIYGMIMKESLDLYYLFQTCTPLAIITFASLMIGMDCFTGSSISLEGKTIWQLQCLPVSYKQVLNSKALTAILLNGIPGVILALVASYVLRCDAVGWFIAVIGTAVMTVFFSYFDLLMNILMPNLKWTNETTVVKQSGAIFCSLFGSWAILAITGVGCYFLSIRNEIMSVTVFTCVAIVLFALLAFVLKLIVQRKGTALLRDLWKRGVIVGKLRSF